MKNKLVWSCVVGVGVGLIALLMYVSNFFSYLSDDSKACVNCHVMRAQYATWFHSSHREQASCNDCHVPHDSAVKKYWFKMKDGMRHASLFTFGEEKQVVMMQPESAEVVQSNCLRCHGEMVKVMKPHADPSRHCWECHRETPHGRQRSLSATPYTKAIKTVPISPRWIIDNKKK